MFSLNQLPNLTFLIVWLALLQLDKEVRELRRQLDLAHSQIEDLIRASESNKCSEKLSGPQSSNGNCKCNGTSDLLAENSEYQYLSDATSYPSRRVSETCIIEEDCDDIKEVQCIEMDESAQEDVGNSIDYLAVPHPDSSSSGVMSSGSIKLTRSRSCRASLMTCSSDFEIAEESQSTPLNVLEKNFIGRPEGSSFRKPWKLPPIIYGANDAKLTRNDSLNSDCSSLIDAVRNQGSTQWDEDIPTLGSFVAGLREMAKLQYENEAGNQVGLILSYAPFILAVVYLLYGLG